MHSSKIFLSKDSKGVYHVYYYKNGKRTKTSTRTKVKKEANKFFLEFVRFYEERQAAKIIPIKLKRFLLEYLKYSESVHSWNTTLSIKSTVNALNAYFGNIILEEITNESLNRYIRYRIGNSSLYVGKREIAYLSGIFKWAVTNGYYLENISKNIKIGKIPEKQPIFFSESDFASLMDTVENDDLKDLFNFAVNTGMRQMEILTLKWRQVNISNRFIILDNKDHITKSKKIRTIPLNLQAMAILTKRSSDGASESEVIFTYHGKQISQQFISHKFKKIVNNAKLNPLLNFHSLRHTFASWLIQRGAPIYEVSKLLGHSNIKTTEIYAHMNPEDLRRSTDLLNDNHLYSKNYPSRLSK